MAKMIIYVAGMLALSFTDFRHENAFYSLFLPIIDLFFLAFLWLEVVFYFSILGFSKDEYNVFDLGRDIIDLRLDIAEFGLLSAVTTLAIAIIDASLLLVALVFAVEQIIELVLL
jgi:hypothetical protein